MSGKDRKDQAYHAYRTLTPDERYELVAHTPGDVGWKQGYAQCLKDQKAKETKVHAALDSIAKTYNSSTASSQDIINAVSKSLQSAGYELQY